MPEAGQDLVVQGIQALSGLTSAVEATGKAVDAQGADLHQHLAWARGWAAALDARVDRISEEVKRCQDRADREDTQRQENRSLAVRALATLWGTAELRLLFLLVVAGWLGVRLDFIRLALPGGAP